MWRFFLNPWLFSHDTHFCELFEDSCFMNKFCMDIKYFFTKNLPDNSSFSWTFWHTLIQSLWEWEISSKFFREDAMLIWSFEGSTPRQREQHEQAWGCWEATKDSVQPGDGTMDAHLEASGEWCAPRWEDETTLMGKWAFQVHPWGIHVVATGSRKALEVGKILVHYYIIIQQRLPESKGWVQIETQYSHTQESLVFNRMWSGISCIHKLCWY